MKVIHLSSFYTGSSLYANLFSALDKLGVSQQVYAPVKSAELIGKNKIDFTQQGSRIYYSHILSVYSRLNYWSRLSKTFSDADAKLDFKGVDMIHAHSCFFDGGVALRLSRKYNIPYVVAVRNTDLNLYFKYIPLLWKYGRKILLNARQIVFISAAYKNRLLNHCCIKSYHSVIEEKSIIVPNGIDNYWLENAVENSLSHKMPNNPVRLVFIGALIKLKNIRRLMEAIAKLNQAGIPCHLDIVGPDGGKGIMNWLIDNHSQLAYVQKFVKKYPDYFTYHGRINDKNELKNLLRQSDVFVMPSLRETFGLVYVEALSQGIPVVYTKGEGIDGMFDENIGEAVNPFSTQSICMAIEKIAKNYELYQFNIPRILGNHSWEYIAQKFHHVYNLLKPTEATRYV